MVDAKLFQIMAEQVQDYAVFLLDPNGCILSWNLGAQKIKGYAPAEIIGKHFSIFYPPEAVRSAWPERELEMARKEGRFEDEGFRVRKDGGLFWANVIITALRDEQGNLLAFSKITRDVSERRRQEESLRQSEERFRLLVEGVLDYAIYMLDTDGIVTSWNNGAERITGYTRTEVIGQHFSIFYPAEDIKAGQPEAELALARSQGRVENEEWRVRRDGGRFWARVVVTPLYDSTGQLCGFAKVTQDLSQQRHIQELEASAQKVNEFIAVLAHELRNPLAPIQTALDIMEKTDLQDELQIKMRQMIARQSSRLIRIVDDILDISRITRGILSLEKKLVELNDLVERAVEVAAPAIAAAKHHLELILPSARLAIVGDMQRLIQVLSNLLNNAARYTPPGGRIDVLAWAEKGQVVLCIRDNGRGIAADSIPLIFQMFVRGRSPLERVGDGLGVGLAVARSIVQLHGGTIEAFSAGEGKGSEFRVRLPAADLADRTETVQMTSVQAPSIPLRPVASKKVLLVEDNLDAAVTLDSLLQMLGHKTCVVHDGAQALLAFAHFQPEIVLLDLGLPSINGYEVARRLRAQGAKDVRIIAITGWGQPEDRQQSAAAGFDLHLVKPIDEHELNAALAADDNLPS